MDEEYIRSKELLEESLAFYVAPEGSAILHWKFSIAACGLGDYPAAKQHLRGALDYWIANHYTMRLTTALAVAPVILAHDSQIERAVEVLGLAFTHPASATGWMEKWPLLTRLRTDLQAELGEAVYQAAWERGTALDLEAVVNQLLDDFAEDQA